MDRDKLGRFMKDMIPWNKKEKIKKVCLSCKKEFYVHPYRKDIAQYCSLQCRKQVFKKGFTPWNKDKKGVYTLEKIRGINHWNWKNGMATSQDGYILIKCPNHPFANGSGYVPRSHIIMEKVLNRYIKFGEIIHHKGIKYPISSIENKQDDRPENLELFANRGKHLSFHRLLKRQPK